MSWFDRFNAWLRRVAGFRYGLERVMCPHCGGDFSYDITVRDGGQVVVCYSCRRNFCLGFRTGHLIRVERQ
jgi:hypothetical protein